MKESSHEFLMKASENGSRAVEYLGLGDWLSLVGARREEEVVVKRAVVRGGAAQVIDVRYLRSFDGELLALLRAGRKTRVQMNGIRLKLGARLAARPVGVEVDSVLYELQAYNSTLWWALKEYGVGLSSSSASVYMHVADRYGALSGTDRGLLLTRSFTKLYEMRKYFMSWPPAVAVSDAVYDVCPDKLAPDRSASLISVDPSVKRQLELLAGGGKVGDVVERLLLRHLRFLQGRAAGDE